jgi:omega-6 fatty acid desaturase (delta-12 desaturase)
LLASDIAVFVFGNALVIGSSSIWIQLLGTVLVTIAIVRLFILGHDACHQSLTDHAELNKVLGRIAFLPSLTPFALWRVGHNVVHHGFNNLKGRDFVWQPMDPAEYAALSRPRQWVERMYRSAFGPLPYYLVEIWWKKLYYPAKDRAPGQRAEYFWDSTAVTVFAALWIAALLWFSPHTLGAGILAVTLGFLVPFLCWNWTVGFVIYVHHTHPDTIWYADKSSWLKAQGIIRGTVRYRVKPVWNFLLHNIMEHGAHHLDARIPLYRLKAAQAALARMVPDMPVIELSFATYWRTVRECKLFDFTRQVWVTFPRRGVPGQH